jgi:hypothetical protein
MFGELEPEVRAEKFSGTAQKSTNTLEGDAGLSQRIQDFKETVPTWGGGHSSDNLSWFKITLKIECTRKLRNNQAKNIFNEDFWEKKKFKHMFTRSLSA